MRRRNWAIICLLLSCAALAAPSELTTHPSFMEEEVVLPPRKNATTQATGGAGKAEEISAL